LSAVSVPFIPLRIAWALSAAMPFVQVGDRVVLLPAVVGALVVSVKVHVALTPVRLAVLLLLVREVLLPSLLLRKPLLPLLMELPLLLKSPHILLLPLIGAQV
jgi:hypothetical protein